MVHPGPGPSDDGADDPARRFFDQLGRTVDRLRSLSLDRLSAAYEPEPTRADAGRSLAQRLADAAATLEGRDRRTLPRLADAAVGDMVAVCGRDLLVAALERGDADAVLAALADDLLDLRRRL
ncbi:MAG: hypothetical protein AB7O74_12000 [Candidatus Nanopelagicales bacterium]